MNKKNGKMNMKIFVRDPRILKATLNGNGYWDILVAYMKMEYSFAVFHKYAVGGDKMSITAPVILPSTILTILVINE